LGREGGVLAGLTPAFRWGLGAVIGSGRQWVSWIHLHDLVDLFLRFMRDYTLAGPFNNTAPHPVTHRELARQIGQTLHRPVLLHIPGWARRSMLGERAQLYLTGQRVIPARHLEAGYLFRYPRLADALVATLRGSGPLGLAGLRYGRAGRSQRRERPMTSHDETETPQPRAPERVSCAVCRKQIPPDEALQNEGEEYLLWFCGLECYESWKRDRDSGTQR
jgi:hypothetical protein